MCSMTAKLQIDWSKTRAFFSASDLEDQVRME